MTDRVGILVLCAVLVVAAVTGWLTGGRLGALLKRWIHG